MAENVMAGDVLQIPSTLKDFPPVTISWTQDTQVVEARVARTATYCACYGYNMVADRRGREVLVFIATEMISDAYSFVDGHLSKTKFWREDDEDVEVSKKDHHKPKTVAMDKGWQYGTISGSDRFVVYHPKSRKPYTKRFTSAVSQTPGALNSIIADAKTGVGLVGDKDSALLTMGMLMGLSVAQTVVGKVAEAAESAWGKALQDFSLY